MRHYSEVDLLETYYTQPGESMPVMMHLSECQECAARYDKLEKKLRTAAGSCHVESKPETFWARQRIAITRRIGQTVEAGIRARRFSRIAAAAVLSFLLGGAVVYETSVAPIEQRIAVPPAVRPAAGLQPAVAASKDKLADELQLVRDPWQSDELSDFHNVVSWESWVAESSVDRADGSSL